MQRIARLILGTVVLFGCGEQPATETATAPLLGNYNLGWSAVLDATTAQPIKSLFVETQFPLAPWAPSAGAAFNHWWGIDNGGHASFHSDGIHFDGDLNSIGFQIYLVKANAQHQAYYQVLANGCYTDGTNHGACQTGVAAISGLPTNRLQAFWQNGAFVLNMFDASWNLTWGQSPVAFQFFAGVLPNRVYSPEVMFSIDSSSDSYGGCRNDVPLYDLMPDDNGHYEVKTMYGTTNGAATTPAYLSAPLSNSKCSMTVNHYPAANYDQVQWHVSGF